MSADNYYVVRECICHQFGVADYVALQRFASDDVEPPLFSKTECVRRLHFTSPDDAYQWAVNQHTEYGVFFSQTKFKLTLTLR